ncbi:MAG: amidase [Rhodospirillales bacterium]|nr:amidase [Rhodospirillales bacterium]
MGQTLKQLAAKLDDGSETSRSLVETCVERILDETGEGRRVFIEFDADAARDAADGADLMRRSGHAPSPFAGIPFSIKDLFDVAGEVTRAGSKVLLDQPKAARDAPVVARLKAAGFVIMGKTNMTEFAYSGLGINPHYGTPLNPHDRAAGRIPGGSTSGGAVSVADGMAGATLGTDTGGSCRIPAALCGIVGFKSTAKRIPREGVVPLSASFDSVGPLANSVSCCAIVDSVVAGRQVKDAEPFPADGLRLSAPRSYVLDDLDDHVARTYEHALRRLSEAGARITEIALDELTEIPGVNRNGGIVGMEAHAWHRPFVDKYADRYDPWILARFDLPKQQSAADYIDAVRARRDLIERVHRVSRRFDALVMPAVAITAPTLAELEGPEASMRATSWFSATPWSATYSTARPSRFPATPRGKRRSVSCSSASTATIGVCCPWPPASKGSFPQIRREDDTMPSSVHLDLAFIEGSARRTHTVAISQAIIGGWTARDKTAMEEHITELVKIGVPRPTTTPLYYRVGARRITTDDEIQCMGADSSGEVEFVLLQAGGTLWVGAGSDHTDRKVETVGITVAKQICDKPIASEFWPYAEVAPHWDDVVIRAFATIGGQRTLYQEGTVAGLLSPEVLLEGYYGEDGAPEDGTIIFGGTLAVEGGVRPAERFEFELEDPVLGRTIRHGYSVAELPNLG